MFKIRRSHVTLEAFFLAVADLNCSQSRIWTNGHYPPIMIKLMIEILGWFISNFEKCMSLIFLWSVQKNFGECSRLFLCWKSSLYSWKTMTEIKMKFFRGKCSNQWYFQAPHFSWFFGWPGSKKDRIWIWNGAWQVIYKYPLT